MILGPSPFFGFNSVYKGPVNFVAFAPQVLTDSNGQFDANLQFRISGDGERYLERAVKGDLAVYIKSGAGQPGAAFPTRLLRFGGKLYMASRIIDLRRPDLNHDNRGALFRTEDGETWDQIITGIEGTVGGKDWFVDLATDGTRLIVLRNDGTFASSTDGESFTNHGSAGLTGTQPAMTVAATASGIAIGGISGQLRTAASVSGSFTTRTSQFGTDTIQRIITGDLFVAVGGTKISTAPLTNLSTWTLRTNPGGTMSNAVYGDGRQFAFGGNDIWNVSDDAVTWAAAANKPQDVTTSRVVTDAFFDGTHWHAFLTSGRLAKGDGTGPWQIFESAGLPAFGSIIAAPVD